MIIRTVFEQLGGLMEENFDFIDLLIEELKESHYTRKDYQGNGDPAVSLDRNSIHITCDKDGEISILGSYKWFRLGSIHEEDIIDRVKKAIG